MRQLRLWLFLVAVLAIFFGCFLASQPPGASVTRAPAKQAEVAAQTNTPAATVEAVAVVTIEATEAAEETPTQAPTETEVAAAEQVDYCVECHTDKDQLVNTADPVEEVVEESEGAG